jgi:hypothetical protein
MLPGKPAEHLSAHYQLGCDYGNALMTFYWEDDGSEPIYLCGSHATELGRSGEKYAGMRAIEAKATDLNYPTISDDQAQSLEVADAKPNASAPSDTTRDIADAMVGRAATDAFARAPARDLIFGNSTKALVDEAIWNMATGDYEVYRTALQQGKPAAEAAKAAGGQLAMIHRKISEYALKIEAVLSKSKARINVGEVIDKPLEHATLELIGNGEMGDAAKDAAIDQLGAFQEWIKHGLDQEITLLDANRIVRAIGDRVNWGASADLSEELKPAYRAVYGSLRNAIRAAVPDVQILDERLANLYAARSDIRPPGIEKTLVNSIHHGDAHKRRLDPAGHM